MAADATPIVRSCVDCAKIGLVWVDELASENILGDLNFGICSYCHQMTSTQMLARFRYILVMADRFTELAQRVQLRLKRLVDVTQAFFRH